MVADLLIILGIFFIGFVLGASRERILNEKKNNQPN